MVLDKLGSSLKGTLAKIAKSMFVDEKLINELVKDIQRALLQADVNVKLVFELSKSIKKRAIEEKAPGGVTQKEYLIKVVYEELVKFLGGEKNEIKVDKTKKPFKIMMVGLFGSGKTTSISKLAKYYMNRGFKVATVGLDVHRPAAPQQLKQLSDKLNLPCFINEKEKNALKIYKEFEKEFSKYDLLLVDTAGRDALSEDLVEELKELNNYIKADEKLLVISADIGQAAQNQAQSFHEAAGVTGVFVTKLDGTAKGGGALSACNATDAPIKFIGVGEKPEDIEVFNPKGFVGRLLGMGDLETLLEKAQEAMDKDTAEDLGKRMLKGEFNFLDLYEQMEAMGKMGSLKKIMGMIPGMSSMNIPKDMLEGQEEKLKVWKIIMQSCTKEELEDPDILTRDRIDRIAQGAGVKVFDVRSLLKQYKQSKKMMKLMKGTDDPNKLMKKMKGKMPKGFKI
ncbi:MAG: signal recognition particle protein Srp54 [Nanoarchaeota archaeon]|nr:signal recognition particle protein Srp54 [Nanoarchaeota archaeon]